MVPAVTGIAPPVSDIPLDPWFLSPKDSQRFVHSSINFSESEVFPPNFRTHVRFFEKKENCYDKTAFSWELLSIDLRETAALAPIAVAIRRDARTVAATIALTQRSSS